jgi:lipopolysaccharide biosynthesis glycosyltransferase
VAILVPLSLFLVFILAFPTSNSVSEVTEKDTYGDIPIVITIDDGYIYPTIVCLTSLLENSAQGTSYKIDVLVPDTFSKDAEGKLTELQNIYPEMCKFEFFHMGDAFEHAPLDKNYTKIIYYKLKIPSVLSQRTRALYLDMDALVLKDLKELYNLNLKNNYIGIVIDNVGLLVWDLELSRKESLEQKFYDYLDKHRGYISGCPEQTLIREVCEGRMLSLPFKFNTQTFLFSGKSYNEDYWANVYARDKEEYDKIWNWDPETVFLHYAGEKPWKCNETPVKFQEKFWEYAKKTYCWSEIESKYHDAYEQFLSLQVS